MNFALDDQIASQPQAVQSLLERIEVPEIDVRRPLYLSGIGTSLHACHVAAYWLLQLSRGQIRPVVANAHDLAFTIPLRAEDQVIVVSHRGTKRYPKQALQRARHAGATTFAIVGEDAPEQDADFVIRTCAGERAGTHTVSYVTALTALGCLVARAVGAEGEAFLEALKQVPQMFRQVLQRSAPIEVAKRIARHEPLLIAGVGLDAITACEAALKIKEGTYQWAEGMAVENALHGPPAAMRTGMGGIVITPDGDDGGRAQSLRETLHILGAEVVTCGTRDEDLWFPTAHYLVRPIVSIVPLQRLAAELARINRSNPDEIHRDVEPWNTAMGNVTL